MTEINVTGSQKYVQVYEGTAIVNGQVLYITSPFRVENEVLLGADQLNVDPAVRDYGDYYLFLRPSRAVMEAYYTKKNWEWHVDHKYPADTFASGIIPTVGVAPDEFCIGLIKKRLVSGAVVLTVEELNRGLRLINSKDISDDAILMQHLDSSITSQLGGSAGGKALSFLMGD